MGELDSTTIREIHERWERAQPADAPTFGGPDGNQFFADDGDFWAEVDREIGRRRTSA